VRVLGAKVREGARRCEKVRKGDTEVKNRIVREQFHGHFNTCR
jgi:hypothetical protein